MVREIRPTRGVRSCEIRVPGSKSITNRVLLSAALAEGTSNLTDLLISDDTVAFKEGLVSLGFHLEFDEAARRCRVIGSGGTVPRDRGRVWTESAGTAARFLTALIAAGEGVFEVDGTAQMRSRPMRPLIEALGAQGAEFEPRDAVGLPLFLTARGLAGGEVSCRGQSQSSQFYSALMLVAPMARSPVQLEISGVISQPYLELTAVWMERFGVRVDRSVAGRVEIQAPQTYRARNLAVEADASSASYFAGAAALTGSEVHLPNLPRASCTQGDIRFLDVLEEMGCRVSEGEGVVVRGPQRLKGLEVEASDFSDTFMTLACLAPFADAPVTIRGIGHTRLQESDRITAVARGLGSLGVRIEEGEDWIRVHPSTPRGGLVESFDDHRIAMSFSLVGLRVPGVRIQGAECVSKTFPDFFEVLQGFEGELDSGLKDRES